MIILSSTELLSYRFVTGSVSSSLRSDLVSHEKPFLGIWCEHLFMTKKSKRTSDGLDSKIRFFPLSCYPFLLLMP